MTDTTRVIINGSEVDFSGAVNLMDADLCDELHSTLPDGTSPQEFVDAYVRAHADKFAGEQFCAD